MKICEEIVMMIEDAKYMPIPVCRQSNLCTELGFDSLSFISFLIKIEDTYSITFDVIELAMCISVDTLISLVESKVKERDAYA